MNRLLLSLIAAAALGGQFANMTQGLVERFPQPPILEYDPGTAYLSRYLGQPDEEEMMEADPADAPSHPNNDRFYRTIAARVKATISNPKDKCGAFVRGMGACDGARGWPFTSRGVSYAVDAYEHLRVDGKPSKWYLFRADEFGLDPNARRAGGAMPRSAASSAALSCTSFWHSSRWACSARCDPSRAFR